MDTAVKTPVDIFYNPSRLLVPLFQRPYVWSKAGQWSPLWDDVRRVAERLDLYEDATPHFFGAVVLQQQKTMVGVLGARTIIDGQQRLTTLQLLLDSVRRCVLDLGYANSAEQLTGLIANPESYRKSGEDRYKVWPTNRDRPAFNEVMSTPSPVEYAALVHSKSRMAEAHRYFSEEVSKWIEAENSERRADALVRTVSYLLQIVVIELEASENAQEIFETLNARGTPLTAADLIKNFVFQRFQASENDVEKAYKDYWEGFETPFWEKEVTAGRLIYSRSSLFLSQWLISKSKKDVPAREVFSQFKRYVSDTDIQVIDLLNKIHQSASLYKDLIDAAGESNKPLDRCQMFVYRTSTLESEITKPLLLWLLDPDLPKVPSVQLEKAVSVIESWLVRRSLVRASTNGYNRFFVDLLVKVSEVSRNEIGDVIENVLSSEKSPTTYWPDDSEVHKELITLPIYSRLFVRGRLRMILEAIEDHRRGWLSSNPLHEQPVPRGVCSIEHVMPQEWRSYWKDIDSEADGERRDVIIHTLGNLTLVTQALNSKVSNGPWLGVGGKREVLSKHTSLFLTREIVEGNDQGWTEALITDRTEHMIEEILEIWPVPADHTSNNLGVINSGQYRVQVADLVKAGILKTGQVLHARPQACRGLTCEVSEDGSLFVGDVRYETPSAAAKAVSGAQSEAGWSFWLVDVDADRSLADERRSYLEDLHESDTLDEEV